MFEYLELLTLCQFLSEYCHGGKILLRFYYDIRAGIVIKGGRGIMNENEIMIINKIRKSNDPEIALRIATDVILAYLTQKESSQSQSAALLQESCAIA